MKDIRIRCNLMVDLSKFSSNKKISSINQFYNYTFSLFSFKRGSQLCYDDDEED